MPVDQLVDGVRPGPGGQLPVLSVNVTGMSAPALVRSYAFKISSAMPAPSVLVNQLASTLVSSPSTSSTISETGSVVVLTSCSLVKPEPCVEPSAARCTNAPYVALPVVAYAGMLFSGLLLVPGREAPLFIVAAATLLTLEGQDAPAPRESLDRVSRELGGETFASALRSLSEVRETGKASPGAAREAVLALLELLARMRARADKLGDGA